MNSCGAAVASRRVPARRSRTRVREFRVIRPGFICLDLGEQLVDEVLMSLENCIDQCTR